MAVSNSLSEQFNAAIDQLLGMLAGQQQQTETAEENTPSDSISLPEVAKALSGASPDATHKEALSSPALPVGAEPSALAGAPPIEQSGLLIRLLWAASGALTSLPGVPIMAAGIKQKSPLTVLAGISQLAGSIFRDPHEETFEGALSQHTALPGAALLARAAAGVTARTQKVLGFAGGGTVPSLLGGQQKQQTIPSFMGTPGPIAPEPPEHFLPEHMAMIPAQAMRQVQNKLIGAGMAPIAAQGYGKAIADFVANWSLAPKNVGNRVLGIVGERTQDMERALAAARSAQERARALPTAKGFAEGGIVSEEYSDPDKVRDYNPVPMGPKGTDTVPAMLTPGERVISREDSEQHKEELDEIQGQGSPDSKPPQYLQGGGAVGPPPHPSYWPYPSAAAAAAASLSPRLGVPMGAPVGGFPPPAAPLPVPPPPPLPVPLPVPAAPLPVPPPAAPLPVPLPVTVVGAATPGGPPVPAGTVLPGPATGGPGAPGPRKKEDFDSLTDTIKKFAGASTLAFGAVSAGLAGLAHAASPALFQTLTQSAELLAATLGSALVEPVLALSFKIQELANWVRQLDPALKAQIGTWAGWTAGMLGAAVAVTKLVGLAGNLLPILTGLKAAMVFTVTNPFGLLLAGLGALAAFHPEAFKGIGEAISSSFADLGGSVGSVMPALRAFADLAAEILVPVLNVVAGAIRLVTDVILTFQQAVGPTAASITLLGAGLFAFGGPARVLITLVGGVIAILTQLGPVGHAAAAGITGAAIAIRLMGAAMAATPWGIAITAISALIPLVMQLGNAFGLVKAGAADAAAAIAAMKGRTEKLLAGGKVTEEDIRAVMTPEERQAYAKAKPEDRKAILEKSLAGAKEQEKRLIPEGERGKVESLFETTLGQTMAETSNFNPFERQRVFAEKFAKELHDMGLTKPALLGLQETAGGMPFKLQLAKTMTLGGDTPENRQKLFDILNLPGVAGREKTAVLEAALGAGAGGVKEAGDFDSPRAKRLKALSGLAGVAYQKEMAPQQMDVGQVRGMVQNLGLAMNPIEQKIFEENRTTNELIREYLVKQLERIADNTE